ncbi:MAG: AMP-binding protein [Acidimicrobiia bacterium]|nr:AMP-binding protein [Acidimicrobiia bacterium]
MADAGERLFGSVPLGSVREGTVIARDDTQVRTVGELGDRVARTANWVRAITPPGGVVAVMADNRVEILEVLLAAVLAGRWLTPVNPRLTAAEVRFILTDSDAALVLTDERHDGVVRAALAQPDTADATGTTDATGALPALDAARVLVVRFGDELDRHLTGVSDRPAPTDGPPGGTMVYTSGTTGRPKGVRRSGAASAAAQLAALAANGRSLGLEGNGPHLVTGPLSHAAPLGFALMDLCNGAPVVLMERWDAAGALDAVTTHEITTTHLVPTMCVRLLRLDPERRAAFDPSRLRLVLHGAAPMPKAVKAAMIAWWGPVLVEYWGGSEGGVVTLATSAEWETRPGTVGRPIGGRTVRAVGDDGQPLDPGEVGLLYAHHPGVERAFRYHGNEAATDAAHLGPGEYTLGDIGWVDDDGFVHLVDRASEMIISGGVNVYPAEVEQVLAGHPAVADVAVVGAPDPEWGEVVVAVVELETSVPDWTDGPTVDVDRLVGELETLARASLAGYKVPRRYEVVATLPRQPNGKLYRRQVRDRFWAEPRG